MKNTPIDLPSIFSSSEVAPRIPTPLANDERIGFAVVGLGRFALEKILPALARSEYCKAVALVSGDRAKANTVASQYGIKESALYDYNNFDQISENPEVQVIYIILPNSMHCEFTVRGANAGKHIMCEKPMATSVEECEHMIKVCKASARLLMIAYRSQYEPADRLLVDMVRNGELGKLREFIAVNSQNQGDPQHWRMKAEMAGGGPLPDIGIYCINAARFISGEEPCEVLGHTVFNQADERFAEIEESAQIILRFPSGLVATASTSYNAHKSQYLRVLGTQGWAHMDPAFAYHGITLHTSQKNGDYEKKCLHQVTGDQFTAQLDHMAKCVMTNTQPHTPGEEGLQDMRIIEALYRSAQEGKPISMTHPGLTRGPDPQC